MPLRITKIEIDNFRAFYGENNTITLPKGENLLVYGENGSGKTSLYRAIKDFFEQEQADQERDLEWHLHARTGPEIRISFAELENGVEKVGSSVTFKNAEATGVMAETDEGSAGVDEEPQNSALIKVVAPPIAVVAPTIEVVAPTIEEAELLLAHPTIPSVKTNPRQSIFDANLAKGFFSYKELLATHLSDFRGKVDLFPLLMGKVPRNWVEPGTGETFYEFWSTIEGRPYHQERKGTESQYDLEHLESNELKARHDLVQFQLRLEASLALLDPDINKFLAYFEHNVEVSFGLKKFDPDDPIQDRDEPQVFLEAQYFGHPLEQHHEFLNEARLSALAISIFLASIKNNPSDPNVLKVLCLDDVFLGLDTGNRIPLLRILNDHFKEYQIIMTTYDRSWFEVAKQHLKGNWKQIEMYAVHKKILWDYEGEVHEEFEFEQPLIVDPSLGYLEKAHLYFQLKDYPTCANYQRKWCEQFLKGYLQENYRLEIKGEEKATEITMLNALFGKFVAFYKDCKIELPTEIESEFHLHRATVMNPFSHDDLQSPVYKQELERGFRLIQEFKSLKPLRKAVIAYRGDVIVYEEPRLNYKCRLKITSEPLSLVNHGGEISLLGKGDVLDYGENDVVKVAPVTGMKNLDMNEFCDKVEVHLIKLQPALVPNADRYQSLSLESKALTLRSIIEA
jgi:energy-coupling factor transporter ATP-binding protein EcfA2